MLTYRYRYLFEVTEAEITRIFTVLPPNLLFSLTEAESLLTPLRTFNPAGVSGAASGFIRIQPQNTGYRFHAVLKPTEIIHTDTSFCNGCFIQICAPFVVDCLYGVNTQLHMLLSFPQVGQPQHLLRTGTFPTRTETCPPKNESSQGRGRDNACVLKH